MHWKSITCAVSLKDRILTGALQKARPRLGALQKALTLPLTLALVLGLALTLGSGCAGQSKKLPPEQTESIQPVQPEQTSQPGQPVQPPQPGKTPLSFTVLDLSAAPKGLRELAGQNREKATATGIKLEGNVYLLITRGVKPTGGYNVEIGPVTQETKAGRTVIVVAVKYTDPKPDQMVTQAITYPMAAAKLNLKTIPHGLSFVFIPEAR
ncbi:MAG: protease complex subunit PrcB family protein [Clostridia bacterium]|nr:protease complex subunit PrcB family protein [Clostridia bacterium]